MNVESITYFTQTFSTTVFFILFSGILWWTYSKENKKKLEDLKYSIFDEDEKRGIAK